MSGINLANERASYQAVFALDIITVVSVLILLGLASKPTFQRIISRKSSIPIKSNGSQGSRDAPLKTTLGTYLFLWPALLCFLIAYIARSASDLLQTSGTINYDSDLSWNGRTAFSIASGRYGTSISALTFTTTLATIFFTVLQTGGVWIHSSHVQSNGTGFSSPKMKSKLWNTFIMLMILVTGLAAWGRGMSVRDTSAGSSGPSSMLGWSNVLLHDRATRIIYVVHECVIIASSLSVSIEVLREYSSTKKNGNRSSERNDLARFTFIVVPLIWLRDIFIVYDIILLFIGTSNWSSSAVLASTFLLVIFRQFANLIILATILWGAWRMGRTVNVFGDDA